MSGVTVSAKFDVLATKLLNQFGVPSTVYKRKDPKQSDASGKTPRLYDQFAFRAAQTSGTAWGRDLTTRYAKGLVMKGPVEIAVGDFIVWGGETYRVMEADEVNPTGSALIVTRVKCNLGKP